VTNLWVFWFHGVADAVKPAELFRIAQERRWQGARAAVMKRFENSNGWVLCPYLYILISIRCICAGSAPDSLVCALLRVPQPSIQLDMHSS